MYNYYKYSYLLLIYIRYILVCLCLSTSLEQYDTNDMFIYASIKLTIDHIKTYNKQTYIRPIHYTISHHLPMYY